MLQQVSVVMKPRELSQSAARSVVETVNCTLYGKSEYEDETGQSYLLVYMTMHHSGLVGEGGWHVARFLDMTS